VSALQGCLFVAWAVVGTLVVLMDDVVRQAVLVGVMGLLAGLTFFSVQAPDVALSMIVVGSVALPVMILLALGRIAAQEQSGGEDQEEGS
jgi:energy-converting hydrogenase B subunit D